MIASIVEFGPAVSALIVAGRQVWLGGNLTLGCSRYLCAQRNLVLHRVPLSPKLMIILRLIIAAATDPLADLGRAPIGRAGAEVRARQGQGTRYIGSGPTN